MFWMNMMSCLLQMDWYYALIEWLSLSSLGQESSQTFIQPTEARVVWVQERDQPSTSLESPTILKEHEMIIIIEVATEMPHPKPNYLPKFQESWKPRLRWYMRIILNSRALCIIFKKYVYITKPYS